MSNFSMSIGGIDLGGSNYGLTLMDVPLSIMVAPKIQVQEIPQREGGVSRGSYASMRRLTVPVAVVGSSFADLTAKLDRIKAVLAPSNGEQAISFDFDDSRYYVGRLEAPIDAPLVADHGITFDMQFLCADPLAYGTADNETVYSEDASAEIAYTGSAYAPLIITGYTGAGNTLSEVTVLNADTNEVCTAEYTLGAGQYIRFDGVREIVEVSGDGSTWYSAMTSLSADEFTFPRLKPAVTNSLSMIGMVGSGWTWTVDWTTAYL